MSSSLRDQLMGLGFKPPAPVAKPSAPPKPAVAGKGPAQTGKHGKPSGSKSASRKDDRPRVHTSEELDLARAYALRQQQEKADAQRAERERQAEAQRRKEARQKLHTLLQTNTLNVPSAELPRHFECGGKIRRVYVTEEQFRAVNAGELTVVQAGGRYCLVTPAIADQAEALMPGSRVLHVDPNAQDGSDDYADPRYQVPDDLVW
jgi:uncharacterized protein YaiL (DUF2058 family)